MNAVLPPLPKLLVLDRDGLICANSRYPDSPFYRITAPHLFVIKPNVVEAFQLLIAADVPFVIATKQRALRDGTLTGEHFQAMNVALQTRLANEIPLFQHIITADHSPFVRPYVEAVQPTKIELFRVILKDYSHLKPSEITVFDDSTEECAAAASLGMNPVQTTRLYESVCEMLGVVP